MKQKIKASIRLFLFKNIWRIEGLFLKFFIRAAYFFQSSHWFHNNKAPYFKGDRINMYKYIVESEHCDIEEINYLEFGVCKGDSFQYWMGSCKNNNSRFFGFDTFTGIPDDWGSVKAGSYSADGKVPSTNDPRAKFEVGLFNETLPSFINNNDLTKRLVIHHDADLYSSTLYVLILLYPKLKKDDIIMFDEFFSVTKADHEFRAFVDFLTICPLKFIPIAKAPNQFAIKIL